MWLSSLIDYSQELNQLFRDCTTGLCCSMEENSDTISERVAGEEPQRDEASAVAPPEKEGDVSANEEGQNGEVSDENNRTATEEKDEQRPRSRYKGGSLLTTVYRPYYLH